MSLAWRGKFKPEKQTGGLFLTGSVVSTVRGTPTNLRGRSKQFSGDTSEDLVSVVQPPG